MASSRRKSAKKPNKKKSAKKPTKKTNTEAAKKPTKKRTAKKKRPPKRKPAKKATAKKATAKKATAKKARKKANAKQTTGRKATAKKATAKKTDKQATGKKVRKKANTKKAPSQATGKKATGDVGWQEFPVTDLDRSALLVEIRAGAKSVKEYAEAMGKAPIPLEGHGLLLLRMCPEVEAVLPNGAFQIKKHPTAPKKEYWYFELAPPKLCNNDYTWHRADGPCPECERGRPPSVLLTIAVEEVDAYMNPRRVRATARGVELPTVESAMAHFQGLAKAKLEREDIELTWTGDPGKSAISVVEAPPK